MWSVLASWKGSSAKLRAKTYHPSEGAEEISRTRSQALISHVIIFSQRVGLEILHACVVLLANVPVGTHYVGGPRRLRGNLISSARVDTRPDSSGFGPRSVLLCLNNKWLSCSRNLWGSPHTSVLSDKNVRRTLLSHGEEPYVVRVCVCY